MKVNYAFLTLLLLAMSGCSDDDPAPALTASFTSNQTTTETSGIVQFSDQSVGSPTQWQWTFEGGSPATSDQQNPIVTYDQEGSFDVKLVIRDGNRIDSLTRENYITVTAPVYEETLNINYGINSSMHLLDLYMPIAMTEDAPLIIMMGGGGFTSGSGRHLLKPIARELSKKGIAMASARYRTIDGPAEGDGFLEGMIKCQQDAKAAVRYFKANASTYGINPNLIFIGGNSSGAHGILNFYYDWDEFSETERDLYNLYGGLDGNQGSPGYSDEVAGILALSGEIYGGIESYIDSEDPPYFGVCVESDNSVTCTTRLTDDDTFLVFGAIPIAEEVSNEGLAAATYIFSEGTHRTPREEPETYIEQLMGWIQPILDNPPNLN